MLMDDEADFREGWSWRAIAVHVVILLALFVLSRFVRALWSQVVGDLCYWLVGFLFFIGLCMWRVNFFRWVKNPDTDFVLNLLIRAVASAGAISALRIATSPLVDYVLIHTRL
jgi:hypothetical protein